MFDLREPEMFEDRGDVVAEPAPIALPQSVPATDRVVGRPGPRLDLAERRDDFCGKRFVDRNR